MRLMTQLALLFYTVVIVLLVGFAVGLALHVIPVQYVTLIAQVVYDDQQLRLIVGLIAVLVFFMNILFNRAITGKELREKNIAFDNPAGRVTVSLSAMEDLIRRIICRMSEVKDVRAAQIIAGKRGLQVRVNLALHSDVSIPETTAQLQEMVKRKILDTIGLEETVIVHVDVTKISAEDSHTRNKDKNPKSVVGVLESTVPFQGYRA